MDFLEHYECVIDLKSKELITNFKTIPLHKVDNNKLKQEISFENSIKHNSIKIPARTEQIFKLSCNLKNTDAILYSNEKEKVRLPNALVKVNAHGEFYTSIANTNAMEKSIDLSDLNIEPFSSNSDKDYTLLNFNFDPNNIQRDRRKTIKEQLRTNHLNEEENDLITNLCLEFSDIFYLEGDVLTFRTH